MPRNGAGVYSLPAGNPVVTLTTIATAWANPTLADITTELTNSVDRGGRGAMTAPLKLYDGTLALPGLAFSNETSMGLYREGAAVMTLVIGGIKIIRMTAAGAAIIGTLSTSGLATLASASVTGSLAVGADVNVSGHITIDATVETWSADAAALQQGTRAAFAGIVGSTFMLNNAYWNAGWFRMELAAPAASSIEGGAFVWRTSPSGAADSAIVWTIRATLSDVGLGIGTTPTTRFHVAGLTSGAIHVNDTGQLYGTALHNNAGAVTGVVNQYVASGTYTPALSNVSNVASSTASVCQWTRVGNVVHVSGQVVIDPTASGAGTILRMSLPIASELTSNTQLAGVAASNTPAPTEVCAITGDAPSNLATFSYISTSVNPFTYQFTFQYEVLA